MIILSILGYILFSILILLILILIIPFSYCFEGYKYEDTLIRGNASWLFGGIRFQFQKELFKKLQINLFLLGLTFNIKGQKDKKSKKDTDSKKKEKKNRDKKSFNIDFIKKAFNASIRVINHIKPRIFELDARIGFEDPYYTGVACGLINIFYSQFSKYKIQVITDFEEEVIEGRFLLQGRIVLVWVAAIAVQFLLSKPVRNILFRRKPKYKEAHLYVN